MMKIEFEKLTGRTYTTGQYETIEKLYNMTDNNFSKQDFAKAMKNIIRNIPEEYEGPIFTVSIDRYPNGNHLVKYVRIVSVSIRSRKVQVEVLKHLGVSVVSNPDYLDYQVIFTEQE